MIERLASILVNALYENNFILGTQREDYAYAFITEAEKIITIFSIIIISTFEKQYLNSFLFSVAFFCLRHRTGGAHFSTFKKCYVGTLIMYICLFRFIQLTKHNDMFVNILFGVTIASVVIIIYIGCVNHYNMNMNKMELEANKKRARFTVMIELGFVIYLILMNANIETIESIELAIIVCSVLMIIAKIMGQEVMEIGQEEISWNG